MKELQRQRLLAELRALITKLAGNQAPPGSPWLVTARHIEVKMEEFRVSRNPPLLLQPEQTIVDLAHRLGSCPPSQAVALAHDLISVLTEYDGTSAFDRAVQLAKELRDEDHKMEDALMSVALDAIEDAAREPFVYTLDQGAPGGFTIETRQQGHVMLPERATDWHLPDSFEARRTFARLFGSQTAQECLLQFEKLKDVTWLLKKSGVSIPFRVAIGGSQAKYPSKPEPAKTALTSVTPKNFSIRFDFQP